VFKFPNFRYRGSNGLSGVIKLFSKQILVTSECCMTLLCLWSFENCHNNKYVCSI